MVAKKTVHVAVGVIRNESNQVLISFRHADLHQGNLWEFPGGKVEEGEAVRDALCREFKEELGISPTRFSSLKKIHHDYADKQVLLDVWLISQFNGEPKGLEGQAVKWAPIQELEYHEFPRANKEIIDLLKLPLHIPITPELESLDSLLSLLKSWVGLGFDIVNLRQNHLGQGDYIDWFNAARELCLKQGITLMASLSKLSVNPDIEAEGVHANAKTLLGLVERPVPKSMLFSASCHSIEELQKAEAMDADFVFLSPVAAVERYGASETLGWSEFARLANQVSLPVYGLGGLDHKDLEDGLLHGAMGIAGISAYVKPQG